MAFLLFPKPFERDNFVLDLHRLGRIAFFFDISHKLPNTWLIRFGLDTVETKEQAKKEQAKKEQATKEQATKEQATKEKATKEKAKSKKESKESTKDQKSLATQINPAKKKKRKHEDDSEPLPLQTKKTLYFIFLVCLDSSDVEFSYKFMKFLTHLKTLDPDPVLILCGTAGGEHYGESYQIKRAIKFDRGSMTDQTSVKLDPAKRVSFNFRSVDVGVDAWCSNYLMQFCEPNAVMDMETFEFGQICEYMSITDYACIRICSDLPNQDMKGLQKRAQQPGANPLLYDAADIPETSIKGKKDAQAESLQKLMRKLLNFETLIRQCEVLISVFTDRKILPTPSNKYEAGSKSRKQDKFILRQINKNLMQVYNFPLEDTDYFDHDSRKLDLVLERIKGEQKSKADEYKLKWGTV